MRTDHLSPIVGISLGTVLGLLLFVPCCTPEPAPHRNLAIVVAKYLNLPNLTCEELGTGWGFTPDTAICQSADLQGAVRVPSTVIWCAAGVVGEPTCRTVADFKAGPKK
jgi:hypothetical protein